MIIWFKMHWRFRTFVILNEHQHSAVPNSWFYIVIIQSWRKNAVNLGFVKLVYYSTSVNGYHTFGFVAPELDLLSIWKIVTQVSINCNRLLKTLSKSLKCAQPADRVKSERVEAFLRHTWTFTGRFKWERKEHVSLVNQKTGSSKIRIPNCIYSRFDRP